MFSRVSKSIKCKNSIKTRVFNIFEKAGDKSVGKMGILISYFGIKISILISERGDRYQ